MTTIVCPIKTITRYDSLPTIAAKYAHAQNVLTVTKRVERSRSIVTIKHKYMLMCNHKIHINLMRCLRNRPHDVKLINDNDNENSLF